MKWISRGTPAKAIKATFTASRNNKLKAKQDQELAAKGLSFDTVFSVGTIQFGEAEQKAAQEKFAKSINLKGIAAAMEKAGTPKEVIGDRIAAIVASIDLNAGVQTAVRAYGVKANGLSPDFWTDSSTATTSEPEELEEVDVAI
jgi:hypothetical protein